MRVNRLALVGLALALPAPALAQSAEAYNAQLLKLDRMRQLAVLRRAVIDAGNLCKRPTEAVPGGAYKNTLMWSVRCVPGGDYGVFLGPSGYVQVRQCGQLAQLRLPTCRLKPAGPAVAGKPVGRR